jgi:hypothetical protein
MLAADGSLSADDFVIVLLGRGNFEHLATRGQIG